MTRFALLLVAMLGGCQSAERPPQSVNWNGPITKSPDLCDLGPEAESFASLEAMPKPITDHFLSRIKPAFPGYTPIAARDQAYDWSDVVTPGIPNLRFIQGGHRDDRWFIWYEHGSIGGDRLAVVGYELAATDAKPAILSGIKEWDRAHGPCKALVDFLHHHEAKAGLGATP